MSLGPLFPQLIRILTLKLNTAALNAAAVLNAAAQAQISFMGAPSAAFACQLTTQGT
jgi:hypothetical protein